MSEKQKYPGPLYAAAGFSNLAVEKLRELPERAFGLREWTRGGLSGGRARAQDELVELGGRIGAGLATVRDRARQFGDNLTRPGIRTNSDLRRLRTDMKVDLSRLQANARRQAGEFATIAQQNLITAQRRAFDLYDDLVARGAGVLNDAADRAPIDGGAANGNGRSSTTTTTRGTTARKTTTKSSRPSAGGKSTARKSTARKTAGKKTTGTNR